MTPESTVTPRTLLPVADGRRVVAVLRELLRPHRARAWVALAALGAGALATVLAAPLLGRIVDLVVDRQPADAVTGPVLALAGIAVAQGLLAVAGIRLVAGVGESMLAGLRERFVDRALSLPLEQLEEAGSGDLTSRVTGDVTQVAEAVRDAVPNFARAALLIAFTLFGLGALDWRFMLGALCAVPVQVVAARWYLKHSTATYAEQRTVAGTQQQQLLDTVGGAATVRAFGLADEHRERVRVRSDEVVRLGLAVIRMQTRFFARLNGAEWLGVAGVLTAGFLLVRADLATIGAASAAALYFINLFGPINQVLFLLDVAQSAAASLARIVGVADLPAATAPVDAAVPTDGRVLVKDLGHAYVDGHPVLADVDLDVASGSTVALVGTSGAGKSTLAKLVAAVHRPTTGSVAIGGVALADLGPDGVRGTVALITQEVHVFAGTLADDLRLARDDATDAQLRDALTAVDAIGWVDALPDGPDTVVGAGAHTLTVVQAQQLALARLVLADPPVAILDEATAEAGSSGARVLETAARTATRGRTTLVVAHRLTQTVDADLVVVMDGGRVVERGSHDELLAAQGRYARLWAAWSAQR